MRYFNFMHPSNKKKKKDIDIRLKMFILYKLWYSENANDLFETGVKHDYFVTTTLPQRKNGHLNNFIYAESILKRFLVRLEFEIKLEPLLLYSPAAAPAATPPPPPLC